MIRELRGAAAHRDISACQWTSARLSAYAPEIELELFRTDDRRD